MRLLIQLMPEFLHISWQRTGYEIFIAFRNLKDRHGRTVVGGGVGASDCLRTGCLEWVRC